MSRRFVSTVIRPTVEGTPSYTQLAANRIGKYWMRIPGIQAVGSNVFDRTIVVYATHPNLVPSTYEGVKVRYELMSGPFVGAMNVTRAPEEVQEQLQHFVDAKKSDVELTEVTVNNYWSHHRLYGIGFNHFNHKYIIYGPPELFDTKPSLLNGKECEYVSLSHMFGGASSLEQYNLLGVDKTGAFVAEGSASVFVKDKLDGSMVGISTAHTLLASSLLPIKLFISNHVFFIFLHTFFFFTDLYVYFFLPDCH